MSKNLLVQLSRCCSCRLLGGLWHSCSIRCGFQIEDNGHLFVSVVIILIANCESILGFLFLVNQSLRGTLSRNYSIFRHWRQVWTTRSQPVAETSCRVRCDHMGAGEIEKRLFTLALRHRENLVSQSATFSSLPQPPVYHTC